MTGEESGAGRRRPVESHFAKLPSNPVKVPELDHMVGVRHGQTTAVRSKAQPVCPIGVG